MVKIAHLLCLSTAVLAQKEDQKKSAAGITLPVITFGTIGLVCLFVFVLVKGKMKDIFQPRRILKRGRPPYIPGMFRWIWIVYKTGEPFLVNTVGIDGVMFLRFMKMGYQLFALLSFIGLFVLAPINFHSNPPTFPVGASYFEIEALLLPSLTIDNIKTNSASGFILWILCGFVWLFSFIAYGFITNLYRNFISLKLQSDEYTLKRTKLSKVELRTCFIAGVPRSLRNEVSLSVYLENLGLGKVENVVLVRNWSQLQSAVQHRAYWLEKMEKLYTLSLQIRPPSFYGPPVDELFPSHHSDAEVIVRELESRFRNIQRPFHKNGFLGIFGEKVDSVKFASESFLEWDAKVQRLRKTPEKSSSTHIAFVTFHSPMSATLLSQCVVHTSTFNMIARMAPEPRDVFWPNLSSKSAHASSKFFRSIFATTIMVLLVTSSTLVISSIAALIDLEQLAVEFPFLRFINDIPPAWRQLIQGIIPVSLLASWNSLLPSVLLILCHLQGLEAESWIQASLLSKYFYYQIWNVIFVIPLANTLVWKILVNPQKVIERLGEMLPKASTTLLNFIILQGLAVFPAQLLLVSPLFFTWLTRLFYNSTARQHSNAYYPSSLSFSVVNYGYVYPVPILVFVIGMSYSIISPIILPFCSCFFAIGYFVMKYLLMYVHFPDYESKGLATTFVVNRCLGGLILMQLTCMGVLALKAADKDERDNSPSEWSQYAQMVFGILPLLAITFFLFTLINQAAKRQIRNVPIEIIGKVQRHFAKIFAERKRQGTAIALANNFSPAHEEDSRLLNRLSVFGGTGSSVSVLPDGDLEYSTSEDPAASSEEIIQPRFSLRRFFEFTQQISPFPENPEEDPSSAVAHHLSSYDLVEDDEEGSSEDAVALMESHLEPPMTRCPGVLNIPLGGAFLRYGEQDLLEGMYEDGQLHTYYHPALIGKLPIAWFEGDVFHDLRKNQEREQRLLMSRLTSQQRLAVDEDIEDEEQANGFKSFFDVFDGLASIVHLTIF